VCGETYRAPTMSDATYKGVLLGESLRLDAELEGVALEVSKVYRRPAGDVEAGQPELWTFFEFEVPAEAAEDLAERLSRTLKAEGGWYCDFHSDEEMFVVFAGRIFRYPRGDRAERERTEEYARSVGVPEAQIDWPD
jgi:hypothetical protein